MPPEEHFQEAIPSDRMNQLTEHAKDERQGKHADHDRHKGWPFQRKERTPVCLGEPDMLMPHERDYLLYVMEDHRAHKVKAGIPQRAID